MTREILFLEPSITPRVMFAPYAVVGNSFQAGAPQVWSPTAIRGISSANHAYALHPDGKRAAAMPAPDQRGGQQDKVVFLFHFDEYLHRLTSGPK